MTTEKVIPPGREAEWDYVYQDEEGRPDDDWSLRSEFVRPLFTHLDDGSVGIGWAFGPQGHPASLAVHLNCFQQDGFEPVLHVLGASPKGNDRKRYYGRLPSTRYLKALLIYGHHIGKRFGHDCFWHRCREGCYGMIPAEHPPYQRCPDCEVVRKRANEAAREWLAENPFPVPEAFEAMVEAA